MNRRITAFILVILLAAVLLAAALYFLLTEFVGKFGFNPIVVILAVNAAFVLYDILLSYAYTFYMKNIRHLLIK